MSNITFDEWKKIEMKVGKILKAERVPETDKLYKLQIDLGEKNIKQIVTGLVPYYKEDELIGKSIVVLANLTPATFKGEISEGMLLCADNDENNECVILTVDKSIKPGTPIT